MSKKRVHEIAKELKGHGIDLDNKDVVNELVSLGYDVKSHSSSLEDDQAIAAVQRIVDKRKPKAAPPPVQARGFVVRRKMPEPVAPAPAPEPEPEVAAPPPAAEPEPLPEVAEVAPALADAAAPGPNASAPRARASAPKAPAASAPRPPVSAVPPPPAAVPPQVRTVGSAPPPRMSAPRGATVTMKPAAGPPAIDPRTQKPTATQAVVLSRPLVQVRRVTPVTSAQRQYPVAPGKKAIGEVREFKVVPDHLGRGRELVDVSRNKEKERPKRGRAPEKEGTVSQQDIRDLMSGRVTIPIRGKKKKPTKKGQKTQITSMAEEKKVIRMQDGIAVADLSQRMGVKSSELIKKLMAGGKMATANQQIDVDTATIIATDYGWKVEKVGFEVEDYLPEVSDKPEDLVSRPPVITVMGHVDHGKTSLLDAIRKANVAAGEAGGITQHIGAYTVTTSHGDLTFLDTPGHEAFSSMRSRGAKLTDIVVLVVAADDGVMPQTKEAIEHARAADVPIVVAVNKMDTPGANLDRVKKSLADLNLLPEDWGGETIFVPVSAKTKMGIETLLENVAVQAQVLELSTNPNRPAVGVIIEAKLEKGRGPVATVLVQEGTLKKGDAVVTGTFYGRVRLMLNERGEGVEELPPGYCAEVVGLSGVPTSGDTINAVEDEKAAKEIADHRALKEREAQSGKTSKGTLESLLAKVKQGDQKDCKIVLKADVGGSLEAVAQAVEKLSTPKVKVTIVHKSVGMMTETDVNLGNALKATVIGFNSRPESGAEAAAKVHEVKLVTYSIIYELLDGVKVMMEDLLEPIRTEKKLGKAEVRQTFTVPKLGVIAGSAVLEGTIRRASMCRLWRENKQIHSGKVASLRRFKDDVKEVASGMECGIGLEGFSDLKAGDIIEAFEIEETRQSLS